MKKKLFALIALAVLIIILATYMQSKHYQVQPQNEEQEKVPVISQIDQTYAGIELPTSAGFTSGFGENGALCAMFKMIDAACIVLNEFSLRSFEEQYGIVPLSEQSFEERDARISLEKNVLQIWNKRYPEIPFYLSNSSANPPLNQEDHAGNIPMPHVTVEVVSIPLDHYK